MYCPGRYQELLASETAWQRLIDVDTPRTFPDVPGFDDKRRESLHRVLHAYSNWDEEVGYCQGMNFLAGLLLTVSNGAEEESFWVLVCLMKERSLRNFYKDGFPLLQEYLRIFEEWLSGSLPALVEHFESEGLTPAAFIHQWYLRLFINCLPMDAVLIIWDGIVCSGLHVLLSVAMSLLQALQNVLMEKHFEEILTFFKSMQNGLTEEHDAVSVGQLLTRRSRLQDMPPHIVKQVETL